MRFRGLGGVSFKIITPEVTSRFLWPWVDGLKYQWEPASRTQGLLSSRSRCCKNQAHTFRIGLIKSKMFCRGFQGSGYISKNGARIWGICLEHSRLLCRRRQILLVFSSAGKKKSRLIRRYTVRLGCTHVATLQEASSSEMQASHAAAGFTSISIQPFWRLR